jgi:YbbR domain-containing protein
MTAGTTYQQLVLRIMWRFIFQNFWFKLVAILMALLLWFHVATDKVYEYTQIFPLAIFNIPSNLILEEKIPHQVGVKIRGKGKELLKLFLSERKSVNIDAKEFKNGETNYAIKPNQIPIPEGLELQVTDILSPQEIKIKLDRLLEKKVKVQPNVLILPADGFVQVGELHYAPKEVVISGPKMWVNGLETVRTQKKVIEKADRFISDQIDLVLPSGYNLNLSLRKINFSVDIQKAGEKKISELPVQLINIPKYREAEIQPDRISVTISGAESIVNQISSDKIKVIIDCAKAVRKEKTKLPIIVELPSEVTLKKTEPDSIEVSVK